MLDAFPGFEEQTRAALEIVLTETDRFAGAYRAAVGSGWGMTVYYTGNDTDNARVVAAAKDSPPIRFIPVQYSFDELHAIRDTLAATGQLTALSVNTASVDVDANQLVITTSADLEHVRSELSTYGHMVRVEAGPSPTGHSCTGRSTCYPLRPATKLYQWYQTDVACTWGAIAYDTDTSTYYAITAAHCGPRDTIWGHSSYSVGYEVFHRYDFGGFDDWHPPDAQILRIYAHTVSGLVADKAQHYSSRYFSGYIGEAGIAVGDPVRASGWDPNGGRLVDGTVQSLNGVYNIYDPDLQNYIYYEGFSHSAQTVPGNSGGPIYWPASGFNHRKLMGFVSTGDPNNNADGWAAYAGQVRSQFLKNTGLQLGSSANFCTQAWVCP